LDGYVEELKVLDDEREKLIQIAKQHGETLPDALQIKMQVSLESYKRLSMKMKNLKAKSKKLCEKF